MALTRQGEHERRATIFSLRNEAGIVAMREQLYVRRDQINREWMNCVGDDLIKMKGAAEEIAKLIKMIDVGPSTKLTEGVNHG